MTVGLSFSSAVQIDRAFARHQPQAKVSKMATAVVASSTGGFSNQLQAVSGRQRTLLEVIEELRITRKNEELPTDYTVSEDERPTVRHDEWTEMGEFPVIDFSRMETDRAGIVKQLYSAASEWGFFQLVNHGLTSDELRELQAEGSNFFSLPGEIKQKLGVRSSAGFRAYIGDSTQERGSALHWAESLMLRPDSLNNVIEKIWPDGNPDFKDAVTKFSTRAETINKHLMELLAEGLRLPTDFFSQHLNSKRTLALRWNFYPACPRPSDVLGASSHTDGCSITLLVQDKVGGLQIQKDGEWIGIKPIEGSLVVNIGDTLHAWSNGIFKSVLHRVVVNESVHRLSLAAFLNVDSELLISAPEELVDGNHPRLYRPFTSGDYLRRILETRYKEQSKSKDGLLVLDGFKLS
ncbi:unnamed protein product [Calypogeia fissa]